MYQGRLASPLDCFSPRAHALLGNDVSCPALGPARTPAMHAELAPRLPCRSSLHLSAQATRQSMLKKYGAIRHAMDRLHNSRLSNYEQVETLDEIRRCERAGGWG